MGDISTCSNMQYVFASTIPYLLSGVRIIWFNMVNMYLDQRTLPGSEITNFVGYYYVNFKTIFVKYLKILMIFVLYKFYNL